MSTAFTEEIHEYIADLPMFDAEVEEIAQSIREVGLLHPLTLDTEGRLIGGRHRLAACERGGVAPEFEVYEGDPLAFILHDNATRKHQSIGQRVAENALSLDAAERRLNGRWKRGTAAIYDNVNSEAAMSVRMSEAGVILDYLGRDSLIAVAEGELELGVAYRQAEQSRDAERRKLEEQERLKAEESDAQTFVKENAPDLADRVDGQDLHSYVEARDIWSRRNREEAREIKRKQDLERKAREEEEKTYRQQAEEASKVLRMLDILVVPEQQQFTFDAITRYPDALTSGQSRLHTPEHLRRLASGLNSYADLLEAQNA